ncbi:hypothetical protein J7W19_07410 [Streptomyces mobaraensis NBRC 13819 = DSM 40847]|uniref:Lipoprotein n=1 Tax=Streptomyces mobaraensis (strain ATCC 29032 / DSM 40847 / JCM 4168 / NBRC 13819 / NCIMB 11159 / IPCR 16-22) TaxID=1223523 RepID=M3BDE6_STRM1|nr:hypothetical protein [Streptomyces mobaraensis]EME97609.1 hypothetical protein H340_25682 [Streptomyces mobaraensis NBRC 13819 = DSM 40847]QTT73264.1 hypothetical protein J7W19_07410 [Streptomyces mobaraensis NBRC 13819 = DSM 40847]
MKNTSRTTVRRLAGAGAAVLLLGGGALATAPSAAAKNYSLSFDKVALAAPGVTVDVTYSCDEGSQQWIVANADELPKPGHNEVSAAGILKTDKLVCDYNTHTARMQLTTGGVGAFAKGSKVKVSLHYFDPNDGFSGFRTERTVTL